MISNTKKEEVWTTQRIWELFQNGELPFDDVWVKLEVLSVLREEIGHLKEHYISIYKEGDDIIKGKIIALDNVLIILDNVLIIFDEVFGKQ